VVDIVENQKVEGRLLVHQIEYTVVEGDNPWQVVDVGDIPWQVVDVGDIPWQVVVVRDMPWQVVPVVGGIPWQVAAVVGDNLQSVVVVVVEDRHRLEFGVVVDTLVVVESDSLVHQGLVLVLICEKDRKDKDNSIHNR